MKTNLTILRDITEEDGKVAPQARTIVDTIKAKVGLNKPIERKAIVEELESSGALNTRQDVARVVSFYQPRLAELGIMAIDKVAEEKPAKSEPADKKPAKAG